jgi:D-aminoacyl-tRNA deacylase
LIALIQRVERCSITVDDKIVGKIGRGVLILLGVHAEDNEKDITFLARKCVGLRIFPDDNGKMNLSVHDIGGEIIVVSQFTLFGDVKKGMRPYFGDAAEPEKANSYYEKFISSIAESGIKVEKGVFGAHMKVDLINDGPVTISINTRDMHLSD